MAAFMAIMATAMTITAAPLTSYADSVATPSDYSDLDDSFFDKQENSGLDISGESDDDNQDESEGWKVESSFDRDNVPVQPGKDFETEVTPSNPGNEGWKGEASLDRNNVPTPDNGGKEFETEVHPGIQNIPTKAEITISHSPEGPGEEPKNPENPENPETPSNPGLQVIPTEVPVTTVTTVTPDEPTATPDEPTATPDEPTVTPDEPTDEPKKTEQHVTHHSSGYDNSSPRRAYVPTETVESIPVPAAAPVPTPAIDVPQPEIPQTPQTPLPKTGDEMPWSVLAACFILSAIGMAVTLAGGSKHEDEKEMEAAAASYSMTAEKKADAYAPAAGTAAAPALIRSLHAQRKEAANMRPPKAYAPAFPG